MENTQTNEVVVAKAAAESLTNEKHTQTSDPLSSMMAKFALPQDYSGGSTIFHQVTVPI